MAAFIFAMGPWFLSRNWRADQLDQHTNGRWDEAAARVLNLYEAKSQLSALVEEAAAGREIVIAKAGVPRARLVPIRRAVRRAGGSKGRIRIGADFEAPLPRDILKAFDPKKKR